MVKSAADRCLPCWLYSELYKARNDFLHGNPLTDKPLDVGSTDLFWIAACLYRLALTAFLDISFENTGEERDGAGANLLLRVRFERFQRNIEQALLRSAQSPEDTASDPAYS